MSTGAVPDAEEHPKRRQLQERIEREVPADLARIGSSLKAHPCFNDQALEQVMEALKANQPAISDKDVERIADRMAERYTEMWEHSMARGSSLKRARERARNIAWGVITGLVTSGTVDLIVYAAHSAGWHAAPATEGFSAALERERNVRIQSRLLAGLPDTTIRSFEHESGIREELTEGLARRLVAIVRDTELIDDLVDPKSWPDGRPIAVTAFVSELWWMIAREVARSVELMRPNDAESPHDSNSIGGDM